MTFQDYWNFHGEELEKKSVKLACQQTWVDAKEGDLVMPSHVGATVFESKPTIEEQEAINTIKEM